MNALVRMLCVLIALSVCSGATLADRTLGAYARLPGQNEFELQGLGLVVGLDGTGDSGSELVMARPLAEVLKRLGNEIPSLEDLEASRSVALVMVTARIPRSGAEQGDNLDLDVSVLHSASSLRGGVLIASVLASPAQPGQAIVLGAGRITLPDESVPTVGAIARGGDVLRRVNTTPQIRGNFEVILDQSIASFSTASNIANEINQQYLLNPHVGRQRIAVAKDPRTIAISVPERERAYPMAFVSEVLGTDISGALRTLPAKVICDTRAGIILLTGEVEVSPAVITHEDLTITTTVPEPVATPLTPRIQRNNFAPIATQPRAVESARLDDLIAAFDQLDIQPQDQIQILAMLHDAGHLHARLIIDGAER